MSNLSANDAAEKTNLLWKNGINLCKWCMPCSYSCNTFSSYFNICFFHRSFINRLDCIRIRIRFLGTIFLSIFIPIFGDSFQSLMREFIPSGIWSNFSLSTYSADINRLEIWQNALKLISWNIQTRCTNQNNPSFFSAHFRGVLYWFVACCWSRN